MFTVCVRDHFMIAHSLTGQAFGPAQGLHGATYIVDAEFRRDRLDEDGVVVDIARAAATLGAVLAELDLRNLDEVDRFRGANTTTEYLAFSVFERLREEIARGSLGPAASELQSLRIVLHESHVAWAAYEGELGAGP